MIDISYYVSDTHDVYLNNLSMNVAFQCAALYLETGGFSKTINFVRQFDLRIIVMKIIL